MGARITPAALGIARQPQVENHRARRHSNAVHLTRRDALSDDQVRSQFAATTLDRPE